MHIFTHREFAYSYEEADESDWIGKYFFTGGIMPSDDLPLFFQKDLLIEDRWRWDGTHYARTCNAWLEKMDSNEEVILKILGETYGAEYASTWFMRWRMFFMACAELFDYDAGQQWFVGHYLFSRRMRAFSGGD